MMQEPKLRLIEQCLESRVVYSGKVIDLHVDEVSLPDGKTARREVVLHPGAVGVLPVTDEGKVVLVCQFRYATGETLWEIPAGKLETGEAPEVTAQRELQEETGLRARELQASHVFYTAPGFCNELIYLYLARGLESSPAAADADEFIETKCFTQAELRDMIRQGSIRDAKTLVALLDYLLA